MADRREIPIQLKGFKGVNTSSPPADIDDFELSQCLNVDFGPGGEIQKRPGWVGLAEIEEYSTFFLFGAAFKDNWPSVSETIFVGSSGPDLVQISGGGGGFNVSHILDGSGFDDGNGYGGFGFGFEYLGKFYIFRGFSGSGIIDFSEGIATKDVSDLGDASHFTLIEDSPLASFGIVHKERLFVANNSRLYYSAIGDFEDWPAANFIDIEPGTDDIITGAFILSDILYIFKSKSIWTLNVAALEVNWTLRKIQDGLGCTGRRAFTQAEGFIYFVSLDGIYKTDGVAFQQISSRVENAVQSGGRLNVDEAVYFRDKILFLVHTIDIAFNYVVYYPEQDIWSLWGRATWAFKPLHFYVRKTEGSYTDLYAGSIVTFTSSEPVEDAFLLHLGGIKQFSIVGPEGILGSLLNKYTDLLIEYQDLEYDFNVFIETKHFEFDNPQEMKRGKWLNIDLRGEGQHQVRYIIDGVASSAQTITETAPTQSRAWKLKGPGYFRRCGIRFESMNEKLLQVFGLTFLVSIKSKVIKAKT